jgi:NADH dehydrogenase [ubiquinone] 1 alpha subcomplex assembly factor 7
VTPLGQRLAREVAATGPMPVSRWMTLCNADLWHRAGSPDRVRLVELGPGRGTLMADMLRSMAAAQWTPVVDFVETSPVLCAAQAARVPAATWYEALDSVPDDAPLFLVANEFFDALPIRQFVRVEAGWRERTVAISGAGFAPALGPTDVTALVPPWLASAPIGCVVEVSPATTAIAAEIGARLRRYGGAALIIDYGHVGPATSDTLQAVRDHAYADPFADPGEVDLTAHVDFSALAVATGVACRGPVGQGAFLHALGMDARASVLKGCATAAQAVAVDAAVERLTGEEAMGNLFKVMAVSPGSTLMPGFA